MNTFRQIPLHMLLLAGLVGTAEAKDKAEAAPAAKADKAAAAEKVAYAGLDVGPRAEGATAYRPRWHRHRGRLHRSAGPFGRQDRGGRHPLAP
jgi:hypothetical protein